MYDVISTANARDYKHSSCGNTGEAPKRDSAMRGLANPTTSEIQPFPSMETNSTLAMSPSSTLNSDIITPKVIKTVNNPIISRNKDQNAAMIQTKANDSIQENPREQKVKKNSDTIKHTPMPQRKRDQWTKPTPKSHPYQHPHEKLSSNPKKSNAKTEEKSTLHTKVTPSSKTKHSF